MATEPSIAELRVSLGPPPVAAHVAEGGLERALERWIARREASARALGQAEGEARALQSAAGALHDAVERLDRARDEAQARLAHTAVELALEIARVLLRREVRAGGYDLEALVRESLSVSGVSRGRCVVHLNPHDARQLLGTPFRSGTEIEPDEGVARGSVHVTTAHGTLVRDLDDALEAIAVRLREETP